MKLAGRLQEFQALTKAAIALYDQPFVTSRAKHLLLKSAKAELLALQDSPEAALEELQRIIDDGWRLNWRWETEINFNFNGIRERPEFHAMIRTLSEDMAEQRARTQAMADRGEITPPPADARPTVEQLLNE